MCMLVDLIDRILIKIMFTTAIFHKVTGYHSNVSSASITCALHRGNTGYLELDCNLVFADFYINF